MPISYHETDFPTPYAPLYMCDVNNNLVSSIVFIDYVLHGAYINICTILMVFKRLKYLECV